MFSLSLLILFLQAEIYCYFGENHLFFLSLGPSNSTQTSATRGRVSTDLSYSMGPRLVCFPFGTFIRDAVCKNLTEPEQTRGILDSSGIIFSVVEFVRGACYFPTVPDIPDSGRQWGTSTSSCFHKSGMSGTVGKLQNPRWSGIFPTYENQALTSFSIKKKTN